MIDILRFAAVTALLVWINPVSNDIFERTARFLKIAETPTQNVLFGSDY
ncbi:MAG TPA: hypothetical protein VGK56_11925 [Anaerolineales bacterium]